MQAAKRDIDPETKVRLSTAQTSCEVGGEVVILHFEGGRYYGLNATGAAVWKALQAGPATVAALHNIVCGRFEVDAAQCASDLAALLENMADAGLVEFVPETQ